MYEIRLLFYVLDIVGIFLFPNELAFWLIIGTKIEKKNPNNVRWFHFVSVESFSLFIFCIILFDD